MNCHFLVKTLKYNNPETSKGAVRGRQSCCRNHENTNMPLKPNLELSNVHWRLMWCIHCHIYKHHYKADLCSGSLLLSDVGWGSGHYCKSVGKKLPVWTQQRPGDSLALAPNLLLCGRKPMEWLPTIVVQCDDSHWRLGEWKERLRLQQERVHQPLRPLHPGLHTRAVCDAGGSAPLVLFSN